MWAVIEKYKVKQFYTAPTAIRALMKFGEEPVKKWVHLLSMRDFILVLICFLCFRHDISSLRILGSVGKLVCVISRFVRGPAIKYVDQ